MKMRKCEDGHYTLEERCPEGRPTAEVHPPKWSPELEQRTGRYRRMARQEG